MAIEYKIKRRHQRYRCDAGVQVQQENIKAGFWGKVSDISLGGCYVSTFAPLPAGKGVCLLIQAKENQIIVAGRTVTSHPGVGMGIAFSEQKARSAEQSLQAFIAQLAGRTGQRDAVNVLR
ncbi:MAG TPA: PilZ domain-containing protein [Alphaproteobacteria bacterium]|nr:PilZ domain-containing protein [Alphaproteobacteria bacterium]